MFNKRKDDFQAPAGEQMRPLSHERGAAKGKSKHKDAELKDAKKLSIITAAAVTVAVAALTYSYFITSNAQQELSSLRQATSPAVVTAADVPQGTVLSADVLKVVDVPSSFLGSGVFTSVDELVGKSTLYGIPANSQITGGMLAGQDNVSALAAALAEGSVGYTVAVDGETGVANLIHQNDRVDVMSGESVILQDIRVAALDNILSGETSGYGTVTLEVTLDQAQVLQAAQPAGPVRLVLRPTVERQGEGA